MANSRMDNLRMVDPVLTTVAQGYSNAAFISDKLYPVVKVNKLKGKIPEFGRDSFVVRDTSRAIGADSNRIAASGVNLLDYETKEHDVETAIDYIEEEESADSWKYEQRVTKDLIDILKLGKEKTAADLAQNLDLYDNDMKKELAESEAFDIYTNSVDPIAVIRESCAAVRSKIAKYPNTMVIGDSTWQALLEHPKVVTRIKYSGIGKITKEIMKDLLEIPEIYIGMSVYSTDGESFTDIWQDNIILAYSGNTNKANSEFNPSYGYTIQREGKPEVDSYYENGGKIKIVRATDNYDIKITAQDAAFIISNTNQAT